MRTQVNTTLQRAFFLALFILFSLIINTSAQSILEPGDIAFTGYITADDNNLTQDDVISFVLLKDIDANTTIFFTDFGWTDAGTLQIPDACGPFTGAHQDGILQWSTGTVLYCGTQITINCKRALTANIGTVTAITPTLANTNNVLDLNSTGDQVLAFQGNTNSPAFIAGISINRDWDTLLDSCEYTSEKSTLPVSLAGTSTALFPNAVNATYNCSVVTGDTLTLSNAITASGNWNTDNTSLPPVPVAFQLPLTCTISGCALAPPSIVIQPSSLVICEGSSTTVSLIAANATTYQWQQLIGSSWINVTDTLPFAGSTSASLSLTSIPASLNNSSFRCVITGAAPPQVISNTITVTVQTAPQVIAQTPARAICEGSNCGFSVTVTGAAPAYQWQYDNGNGWTNLTNTPPYSGTTNSALQIAGSPFSLHLTNYRCIISGTCAPSDTSAPVYIFVNQLPTVTTEPVSDTICDGGTGVFSITATGYTLNYRWQMDTGSGFNDVPATAPFSGATSTTLSITNPGNGYNGALFRCIVAGVCNPRDTSLIAKLTVGNTPLTPTFSGIDTFQCQGNSGVIFQVSPYDNTALYNWTYSGNGVNIISQTDSSALLNFGQAAESGSLTVEASNFCGVSQPATQTISTGNTYSFHDTVTICPGDSAFLYGNWQHLQGNYSDNYLTTSGCDSSFTTTLTFHQTYQQNILAVLCPGDSLFTGGAWQTTAGIYTDTLQTMMGCDSLIITQLSLLPVYQQNVQVFLCNGDSILLNGNWQQTGGIFTDSLLSTSGCDSIITTTLSIILTDSSTENYSICSGDSLFLGGAWQNSSGSYTDHYQNYYGCDSTVVTILSITPGDSTAASLNICQGDSAFLGGVWQNLPGIYSDHYQNTNGCDSTIYTTLTVNTLPVVTLVLDTTVCNNNGSVQLYGGTPSGGIYSGPNVTGNIFDPTSMPAGAYRIHYSYNDVNGCINTAEDTIFVTACTGIKEISQGHISVYPNPATSNLQVSIAGENASQGRYIITDTEGREILNGTLTENQFSINISEIEKGVYFLAIHTNEQRYVTRIVVL